MKKIILIFSILLYSTILLASDLLKLDCNASYFKQGDVEVCKIKKGMGEPYEVKIIKIGQSYSIIDEYSHLILEQGEHFSSKFVFKN